MWDVGPRDSIIAAAESDWSLGSLSHEWSIVVMCLLGAVFLGCATGIVYWCARRNAHEEEEVFYNDEEEVMRAPPPIKREEDEREEKSRNDRYDRNRRGLTDDELAILIDSRAIGLAPSCAGE